MFVGELGEMLIGEVGEIGSTGDMVAKHKRIEELLILGRNVKEGRAIGQTQMPKLWKDC